MPATASSAPTTSGASMPRSPISSPSTSEPAHPTEAPMYLPSRTYRTLIMGRHGAVGTNHPLATQAGLDVLRAGGNAVDASVAIALTLSVVEPMMSGLGGDGFYQVHSAATGATLCWN